MKLLDVSFIALPFFADSHVASHTASCSKASMQKDCVLNSSLQIFDLFRIRDYSCRHRVELNFKKWFN